MRVLRTTPGPACARDTPVSRMTAVAVVLVTVTVVLAVLVAVLVVMAVAVFMVETGVMAEGAVGAAGLGRRARTAARAHLPPTRGVCLFFLSGGLCPCFIIEIRSHSHI